MKKKDENEVSTKIEFKRFLLRDWLRLEEIRGDILEAAGKREYQKVSDLVVSYLSTASERAKEIDWNGQPWHVTMGAYELAVWTNSPRMKFPILHSQEKPDKLPWEYPGRSWYYWLHLFSLNYGWSKEQISNLEIDDAIGLLQEILIQKQLDQEWEWSQSEIAYPFNESTKQGEFKPLPRPDWMKRIAPEPVKRIKIPKNMLPAGVVSYDERDLPKSVTGTNS